MITARQLEALAALVRLGTAPPPSIRELADDLLVSHPAALKLIRALAVDGAVELGKGARAMRPTPLGRQLLEQATAPSPELPDSGHRAWRNRFVFPMPGDAIRCWARHRSGLGVDRARVSDGPSGRQASIDDVIRIGRALAHLHGPQIDTLVAWAMGSQSTTDDRVEALVERVSSHLRRLQLVAPARAQPRAHRSTWRSADGKERATAAFLPGRDDFSCKVTGSDTS